MISADAPDERTSTGATSFGADDGMSDQRTIYAPSKAQRPLAIACTAAVYAVLLVPWLLAFNRFDEAKPAASAPLVVTLLPMAAPLPTKAEKSEPAKEEKPDEQRTNKKVDRIDTIPPIVPGLTSAFILPTPPQPAPAAQPRAEAPKPTPAPTAPRQASEAADSWEGRVLARLEQFRRYPAGARARGVQGVVYLKFRVDRDGRILSSAIQRSSGEPSLDRAALETLKRAEPLPKIPPDRPDSIELSVPVEFYIK
jgi:protein TonB